MMLFIIPVPGSLTTSLRNKQYFNQQLKQCMLSDVFRFRRRWQKIKDGKNRVKDSDSDSKLLLLAKDIEQSISMVESRRKNLPLIRYPENLPISQKSELIKQTIMENQVTILCGETGSGKTTQLPKICLQLGLGIKGRIGHTQPRRLAARAVSQRIAEELNTVAGKEVAYKVRFSDQSNEKSYIKLMTDGILLAECNHDPFLNQYDTIIIDEAHERSLNIDFLLGYLKRLISRRKDLKIIITSATIDPDRFSKHFNNAPVINVSGRTYPVEVYYRPFSSTDSDNKKSLQDGIVDAVAELTAISRGDILVFLSGERDIRETADALNKNRERRMMANTEVLPLLARLSNTEQNRIFHPGSQRRIILATNVAETSLTVPGIKYVIDSGVARISRYSWRSKIQRLPIEKISQASANQRKGRCGRVSEGICIRLYDEDDFNLRNEYTEPEIQRTNLAAVILQMENLRLGHIDDFPFVEPPDERLINDGYKLLFELGAIKGSKYSAYEITRTGRQLARLPIDPKLARILLYAEKHNALTEVLIIVSALATQDPRERPLDKQQAADEKHRVFTDRLSDFLFYINLWQAYHDEKKLLSGNQLRKWCRQNFISWMRIREWIDTHKQIKNMLNGLELSFNTCAASYEQIHKSLLIGFLANVGYKNENREFTGARNKKFRVFPGSGLFKKPPQWMLAAEIVETSQVYARTNAKIDVVWVEEIAAHLLKYHYSNPHWEKKRSQVVALEQSTLYGLIINAGKKVSYGRVNPVEAREIFIRCALIAGDFNSNAAFYKHNKKLFDEIEAHEARSRRRDILVDENVLYDFYDRHISDDVFSGAKLDKWLQQNPEAEKKLFLNKQDLMREKATLVSGNMFPDTLAMNGSLFPLEYHFDPTDHCDGITLVTPVSAIDAVNAQRCEWLVPGMLAEKIIALIRSLPKQLRKNFVPAPNFADACFEAMEADDISLITALSHQLKTMTGVLVPYDAWKVQDIAPHLLMNFRVLDNKGSVIQQGRNIQRIKDELSGYTQQGTGESIDNKFNRDDVGPEIIDELAEYTDGVNIRVQGIAIKVFPALVIEKKKVNLRSLDNKSKADLETHNALRRFIINALPEPIRHVKKSIVDTKNLCLQYSDFGSCNELVENIVNNVIDELFLDKKIITSDGFFLSLQQVRSELYENAQAWVAFVARILKYYREVKKLLKKSSLSQLDVVSDIQGQLQALFPENFVSAVDRQWLQEYPRYLSAIQKRFEKSKTSAVRDRQLRIAFSGLWDEYSKRRLVLEQQHMQSAALDEYRWMLEEYRVSLFAQELKTKFPVSEKRLKKAWNEISDS